MTADQAAALQELAGYLRRNGCVRRRDPGRLTEGHALYKKGDELRFVARSGVELVEIRRLLEIAGLRGGRPYAKGRLWVQPVYGREQVARFLRRTAELEAGE